MIGRENRALSEGIRDRLQMNRDRLDIADRKLIPIFSQ